MCASIIDILTLLREKICVNLIYTHQIKFERQSENVPHIVFLNTPSRHNVILFNETTAEPLKIELG